MQTYRRVWVGATRTLVVVGGLLPLAAWCVVSPWTFAAALAATCWAGRLAVRTGSSRAGRRLQRRLAAAPVVDPREWQVLRLLPVVSLAAVGWSMLLGAAGMALLVVDAAFGLPLLAGDRHDRWPDGRDVGDIPDTVEELAPTDVVEVLEARGARSPAPPEPSAPSEPPPAAAGEPPTPSDEAPDAAAGQPPAPSGQSSSGPSTSSSTPGSWPGPHTLLPDLDDEELLHAWEASTRALGLRPGPTALLRIVTARARYLDALAERDPDGLARRLAMGERDDWTWFDSPA